MFLPGLFMDYIGQPNTSIKHVYSCACVLFSTQVHEDTSSFLYTPPFIPNECEESQYGRTNTQRYNGLLERQRYTIRHNSRIALIVYYCSFFRAAERTNQERLPSRVALDSAACHQIPHFAKGSVKKVFVENGNRARTV